MGPISAVFNLLVFVALWFLFKVRDASTYQTIWFCYSIVANLLGMHIIRTAKIPFIQSNANKVVYISSFSLILIALILPFTPLGALIGLIPIAMKYIALIFVIAIMFCVVTLFAKKFYIKKFREWI